MNNRKFKYLLDIIAPENPDTDALEAAAEKERRNDMIVHRYYYYVVVRKKKPLEEVITTLQKEFCIKPRQICNILKSNTETLKAIRDAKPSAKELSQRFSHLIW
jgi:hypothetical protein